jgi:hypothetical protein
MPSPFPIPDDYEFNSIYEYDENAIRLEIYVNSFSITAHATENATFEFAAMLDEASTLPYPGADGDVGAEPITDDTTLILDGDTLSMMLDFTGAEGTGADSYTYKVYRRAITPNATCGWGRNDPDCILTTACGLAHALELAETLDMIPPGLNASVEVDGLEQEQEYAFNIVVERTAPDGTVYAEAYRGTTGTPEFNRVGQLHSDTTIIITGSVIGGVVLVLVIGIGLAKWQLQRTFKKKRAQRRALYQKQAKVVQGDDDEWAVKSGDEGATAGAAADAKAGDAKQ